MQRKKHVIWQDLEVDIKDFEEILEQDYPDVTDEYEKQRICAEINEAAHKSSNIAVYILFIVRLPIFLFLF